MNTDTATNLSPELENLLTPEQTEGEEVAENEEVDPDAEPGDESEEDQTAEGELEEVDVDGTKYAVPKALKDRIMMHADYTKKTQTLAAQREAYEADQRSFQQATESHKKSQEHFQAHVVEVARLVQIDEELAKYDKLDWETIRRDDPLRAQELRFQRDDLKEARNGLAYKVTEDLKAAQAAQQIESAKRAEESLKVINRDIPGWSEKLAQDLTEYGVANGLTKDQLRQIHFSNPGAVKFLHKAWQFDQLKAKQRASTVKPAPTASPVTQVGARRAPASNEPRDTDSVEVWNKKMDAIEARKRAAR